MSVYTGVVTNEAFGDYALLEMQSEHNNFVAMLESSNVILEAESSEALAAKAEETKKTLLQKIVSFLKKNVAEPVVKGFQAAVKKFNELKGGAKEKIDKLVKDFSAKISADKEFVKKNLGDLKTNVVSGAKDLASKASTVIGDIKGKILAQGHKLIEKVDFKKFKENAGAKIGELLEKIKNIYKVVVDFFFYNNKIVRFFVKKVNARDAEKAAEATAEA